MKNKSTTLKKNKYINKSKSNNKNMKSNKSFINYCLFYMLISIFALYLGQLFSHKVMDGEFDSILFRSDDSLQESHILRNFKETSQFTPSLKDVKLNNVINIKEEEEEEIIRQFDDEILNDDISEDELESYFFMFLNIDGKEKPHHIQFFCMCAHVCPSFSLCLFCLFFVLVSLFFRHQQFFQIS